MPELVLARPALAARQPRMARWFTASILLYAIFLLIPAFHRQAWSSENELAAIKQNGISVSDRKFGDMIGLGVKFAQGQPMSELKILPRLGVRWVREGVYWPDIEPQPGQYQEFPPAFKERLAYYRRHNIGLVYLLAYANERAYPATPEDPYRPVDPEAFGRYAAQAARMLKAQGVRFVLEVWNEPHNFDLRKRLGGAWNGMPPSPWVDHYVRMVGAAVRQVKAVDPNIKLLSDDDMWVLHYRFVDAGLPAALDGFAFHPYTKTAPEIAAVDAYTEWVKPYTVVDADRSFGSAVRRLRAYGKLKLGKTPAMWITEWGWPIGSDAGKGQVDEVQLGAYLPRAFIIAAASGVDVMCWFSAYDSVDGPMGLIDNKGRRRKSFYAFKTMSEQLGDMVLEQHAIGAEHPTQGVQAFVFGRQADSTLVVWNVDNAPRTVEVASSSSRVKINDVFGNPVTAEPTPTGRLSVSFAGAPVYISGLDSHQIADAVRSVAD